MLYKGLHSHLDVSSVYLSKLVPLQLLYPSYFLNISVEFPEEGMLAECNPIRPFIITPWAEGCFHLLVSAEFVTSSWQILNFPSPSSQAGLECPTELQVFVPHGPPLACHVILPQTRACLIFLKWDYLISTSIRGPWFSACMFILICSSTRLYFLALFCRWLALS